MNDYRPKALKAFEQLKVAIDTMFSEAPVFIPYEIKLNGSLAYGTDIRTEKPDLDVFILTPFPVKAFQLAQVHFHKGIVKQGELLIWYFDWLGFPVDLVFENPEKLTTQTIYHTDYFKKNLTDRAKSFTIQLKKKAKKHNLYGAEVGGITGVACTMIGMMMDLEYERCGSGSGDSWWLYEYGFGDSSYKTIDPVVPDRCLTANIPVYKKKLAFRKLISNENIEWTYKVIPIPRTEHGTDREYQKIASAVKKSCNMFRHIYKQWGLDIQYDIYIGTNKSIIWFNIEGELEELEPVLQQIPYGVITDEVHRTLAEDGKLEIKGTGMSMEYWYIHKNPCPNMTPELWFVTQVGENLGLLGDL